MKYFFVLVLALFCAQVFAQPNPCSSNPCQNSGICTPDGSSFTCTCVNRFHGRFCQYSIISFSFSFSFHFFFFQFQLIFLFLFFKKKEFNACESSPCKNGARCNVNDSGNSFTCACINGYTGQFCQNRNSFFFFFLFLILLF